MNEYEEYIQKHGVRPEDDLRRLKDERASYQLRIDKAITKLEQDTLVKNSKHFQINRLKRIIDENSKKDEGRWA